MRAVWDIATHTKPIRNADNTTTITDTVISTQRKSILATTADISRAALSTVAYATWYAACPYQSEVDSTSANSIAGSISVLANRTNSEETILLTQGYTAIVEIEGD